MNKYLKSISFISWIFDNCYKIDMERILNKTVAQAMREDWEKVNQDFANAINTSSRRAAVVHLRLT